MRTITLAAVTAVVAVLVTVDLAAACSRQIGQAEAIRIAQERARALGCLQHDMHVDADPLNMRWNTYRMAFVNTDATPDFLKERDRHYWAVYFEPVPAWPPRTDGDLFVFIDACDGRILGELRWCGR